MGAGGLSVALAMAGEPYYIPMPNVVRVFPDRGAHRLGLGQDVILELLRRRTVKGGVGRFRYAGPGVATPSPCRNAPPSPTWARAPRAPSSPTA